MRASDRGDGSSQVRVLGREEGKSKALFVISYQKRLLFANCMCIYRSQMFTFLMRFVLTFLKSACLFPVPLHCLALSQ